MPKSQHPWCDDFSALSPGERRLARFTLQFLKNVPAKSQRSAQARQHRAPKRRIWVALRDELLPLLQPLFDENRLAAQWPDLQRALEQAAPGERWSLQLDEGINTGAAVKALGALMPSAIGPVLKRLVRADGEAPVSATIAVLGEALGLSAMEIQLLDYLDQHSGSEALRLLLRKSGASNGRVNQQRLAGLLGVPLASLQPLLATGSALRRLGLLAMRDGHCDLEDFVQADDLLQRIITEAPADTEQLLALLIETAPAPHWRLADFPHLHAGAQRLARVLGQRQQDAEATPECGINALFYGPPGAGKTELARAVIAEQGLRAYQVRSGDEEGSGLGRKGRLSAYLLAQRLLARRRDAVLIFDEVEDVFEPGDNLLALLRGQTSGREKGWMNRILEDNPVPAIWITNRTDGMDPAFLRRFLLPIAFITPPQSVRRRMVEHHLGARELPETLLDDLAADSALAPAQFGAARRLLALHGPAADPEALVREGVSAWRELLQGAPTAPRRQPATRFDSAYLNLSGEVTPGRIVKALARHGRGTLCFYGPPGTGKTAFAERLAEALDRELVARQASDLVSKYVGETEQNLARLFRETDAAHSVLLLDEADSFLGDRSQARHSWERTQVNELLQQLERYPGIFIAATNLIAAVDPAALRRFDFKLHFRALTPAQRLRLFAREALGDEDAEVPELIARHLRSLQTLTPGDFANVCRQRTLLDETLSPEQFLRRLVAECRLKRAAVAEAA